MADVFIGDLPSLDTSPGVNDVLIGVKDGVGYTIKINKIPPNSATASELAAIESAITAVETQCSKGNTGIKNEDLYNILATNVLPNMGYTATATRDANQKITAVTITKNNGSNNPADIFAEVSEISSKLCGSVPAYNSSTGNYELIFSLDTAMSSPYTVKLKSTNFDHQWTSGRTYSVGAVVIKDGTILQCNYQNSDTTFNAAHWDIVGGGNNENDSNKFINIFKSVMTGFRKALDPNYFWILDGNKFYESLTSTQKEAVKTTAKDGYNNKYLYGFNTGYSSNLNGDDMDDPNWKAPNWNFDGSDIASHTGVTVNNTGVWSDSSYEYKTDEQLLNSDSLKIRCSILEMLTRMFSSYIDFTKYVRDAEYTLPGYSGWDYNDSQWVTESKIAPDENGPYHGNSYDDGILNYMPFVVNSINVTDATDPDGFNYIYNPYADLCAKIMEMTQPKIVTGKFLHDNWVAVNDYVSSGDPACNWKECKLTLDQNGNTSEAIAVNKDLLTSSNVIMDVRLPSLTISDGNGGYTDQDTLRKQILTEYNKIMDTNLSKWTTNNEVYYTSANGIQADGTHSYGLLETFGNTDDNVDWEAVTAYISASETTPIVDIPVTFLVFPNNYSYGKMFQNRET